MDNEQEPGPQAEIPAQVADLVTMMERPRNRLTTFALAGWTAERRAKDRYIRKTDHGGDWRGPYSTIASVSLHDRARTRQGACSARQHRRGKWMRPLNGQ